MRIRLRLHSQKKKSLNKRLVQTHDSDSDANEYWVTFIELGGWSREEV